MERGPKTSVFGFKNKSTLPTAKQSKRKRNHFKLNANINTNYCVSSATDHFRNQTREGAAVMRALRERDTQVRIVSSRSENKMRMESLRIKLLHEWMMKFRDKK